MESTPAASPEKERTPSSVVWVVAMVLIAAGMVSAGALLVDYTRAQPTFCDEDGACAALRQTPFAYPLGIPMPLFGLLAWLGHAVVWNVGGVPGKWARMVWCTGCGVVGAGLIAVQIREGKFCPFCLVTDVSSVGLMLMGILMLPKQPRSIAVRVLVGVALAVLGVGTAWAGYRRPPRMPKQGPVPELIRKEIERASGPEVPIIDFADFECPFCRMNHTGLTKAIADAGVKARIVRKHVPLDRIHPFAHGAARIAVCGELLGHGEEVAEALFAAEDLSLPALHALAVKHGCDDAKLTACETDGATEARIQSDSNLFTATKTDHDGLPLVWIGKRKFVGVQDPKLLVEALREAASAR